MNERNYKLDIIRIIAFFSLVSLHYWSFQGFNESIIMNHFDFVNIFIRNFFLVCVPFFLILTGYLQNKKKANLTFYLGIKKVVLIYLICSLLISFASFVFHGFKINIYEEILKILSFKGSNYGWYVEMYIGLYFLIPFLNIIWNNVDNKKLLIFIFVLLTIIPSSLNVIEIDINNILNSSLSENGNIVFVNYWKNIYPITYYFLGCFMSENNNVHFFGSLRKDWIVLLLSNFILAIISFAASYNSQFVWGGWQEFSSIFVMLVSISLFSILNNMKIKLDETKVLFLSKISSLTYGAYLLSYLMDNIVYKYIPKITGINPIFTYSYFIYAPIVFISSLVVSDIVMQLYEFFIKRRKTCIK